MRTFKYDERLAEEEKLMSVDSNINVQEQIMNGKFGNHFSTLIRTETNMGFGKVWIGLSSNIENYDDHNALPTYNGVPFTFITSNTQETAVIKVVAEHLIQFLRNDKHCLR